MTRFLSTGNSYPYFLQEWGYQAWNHAEASPISLGVMPSDVSASMTVNLPLGTDASLAISVEPEGGSPTGLPTGPVVAQGRLSPV